MDFGHCQKNLHKKVCFAKFQQFCTIAASEMTYTVLGGALNSAQSKSTICKTKSNITLQPLTQFMLSYYGPTCSQENQPA